MAGKLPAGIHRIEVRGQARYRARWKLADRSTRSKTFDDLADAKAHLARVTLDPTPEPVKPEPEALTFEEWAERWFATRVDLRQSSRDHVEGNIRRHVIPVLGERPIGEITTDELRALVASMGSGTSGRKPLAAATIETIAAHLSGCFKAAAEAGKIEGASPWVGVKVKSTKGTRTPKALTREQVDAMAEAIRPDLRALVVVGVSTGLRPGELAGLRVEDVRGLGRRDGLAMIGDPGPGVIEVRQQVITPASGEPYLTDQLKTMPRSVRDVPVPPEVVDVIRAHVDTHGVGPEGVIFHRDGALWRRQRLNQAWRNAAAELGWRTRANGGPTPHWMRHTFASALISGRMSVSAVSKLLGHSSASTTLDVYSHWWHDDDDRTRAAIAGMFTREDTAMGSRLGSRSAP